MHRALFIPEILQNVCGHCVRVGRGPHSSQSDASALLSLTLSCKTFHDTAIEALWSTLHELSPLIRCFPEDAWTISETGEVELVRPLAPNDWTSFLKYSSYVRHLGKCWDNSFNGCRRLDNEVLTSLLIYRPTLVLFPRLVELAWSTLGLDDENLPAVLGLMGPQVKRISIANWSFEDDLDQYLQTSLSLVSSRFPCLQHFSLNCKNPLTACQRIPGALLSSLHDLRAFHCDHIPLTESAFSALGRLQYLTEYTIRLPTLISWAPLPPNAFPLLREVTITALYKDYLAFSAAIAGFVNVEDATILLRDLPQLKDGLRFFDTISKQFPHSRLTNLSIYMGDDANTELGGPLDSKATICGHHLRRLLSFTSLTSLWVNMACRYALDGPLLTEMAMALPNLESLHIGDLEECIYDAEPANTLPSMTETLAPFATHCPSLRSFGIPFDARQPLTVDDVRDAIPDRPSRCPVTYLDCSHCPIEDGHVVAAYIARVFPLLDGGSGLEFCMFPQLRWEYQWQVVQRQLPWFKMIRDDEKGGTEEE